MHNLATRPTSAPLTTAEDLYLELLKKCLTRTLYPETHYPLLAPGGILRPWLLTLIQAFLARRNAAIRTVADVVPETRIQGRDWPKVAETMIGIERLNNVQYCVKDVLSRGVPGDLIETGVWRGGTTIFMRAILQAYGDTERKVWVADSFEGLPPPDPNKYIQDKGDPHHTFKELAVSLEQVRANFERYGLLDDQVVFLKGFFRETLPTAPVERLAVVRLDGDMYESTMDGLENLYPKLSVGGYIIVDDYNCVPGCKAAVTDYRRRHDITDEMITIDWTGIYWQRSS